MAAEIRVHSITQLRITHYRNKTNQAVEYIKVLDPQDLDNTSWLDETGITSTYSHLLAQLTNGKQTDF